MNIPTNLDKRPLPDFMKIPPLKVTMPFPSNYPGFIPAFYQQNLKIPKLFRSTNFNPSLPHISMGFSQQSLPICPRMRFMEYTCSLGELPIVTGKEIPGNQFYLEKSEIKSEKTNFHSATSNFQIDQLSSKRKYRKKGGYALSALQGEFYEKKIIGTQSSRIKQFWIKKTNTYPFTFKQTKVFKRKNQDGLTVILERHRYDFKRVTPNLVEKKLKKNTSN